MNAKERLRIEVLTRVTDGRMTLGEAADRLGLSYRQMRRVRWRHRVDGDAALVHALRGRASNRKTCPLLHQQVMKLCVEKYVDFGPTLLSEYLLKDESIALSHDTLRRWMSSAGMMPKVRRGSKHRSRRERRGRCGELVQMDGSWHDWFEGRGEWCCLMVMIDDATGGVFARFYAKETLSAAMDVFERYACSRGLPGALYVDRAGIYRSEKEPTAEQILKGEEPATQFGRAMRNLGVELIMANSPQAKGRVERANGTLQDRLVKAMRLAGVSDIKGANRFLDETFLAEFDGKFSARARLKSDAHRAVGEAELTREMSEHHERAVGRDWCVQWRGKLVQIDKRHAALGLAGKRVTLRERGGDLVMQSGDRVLNWQWITTRPKPKKVAVPIRNNRVWKPATGHPWKQAVVVPSSPKAPPAR